MLRSIWRSLTRDPGFTATAVLTLALGIGANTAMFSVIDGVLLKPLAYREPDRLVSLDVTLVSTVVSVRNWDLDLGIVGASIGPILLRYYDAWRAHATQLESIAVMRPSTVNLTGTGEPERLLSAHVSASLFPTLGVRPALGRPFAAKEDVYQGPRLAILSNGFWRRRFGADPAILGRNIQLNGEAYDVIGVMSDGFELPIGLQTEHTSWSQWLRAGSPHAGRCVWIRWRRFAANNSQGGPKREAHSESGAPDAFAVYRVDRREAIAPSGDSHPTEPRPTPLQDVPKTDGAVFCKPLTSGHSA